MKKITIALLGMASVVCLGAGAGLLKMTASAETAEQTHTVELSKTVYKVSDNDEKMLLVTAIKNYTNVYEVGYEFDGYTVNETDVAETTKYYDTLTTGGVTEDADDIFGEAWTGAKLLVWEVANTADVTFTAYAKEGVVEEGGLVKPDVEIKATGIARNNKKYTVTFADEDGKVLNAQEVYNGKMPKYEGTPTKEATAHCTYTFSGWNSEVVPVTDDVTYTAVFEIDAIEAYKAVNGSLVADANNVYNNEEISYKFTASAWDLKWSLADSFGGLIEDSFTIYLKFEATKEDVGTTTVYYGPSTDLSSMNLTLPNGEWVALTIDATKYYQITALDYIFQVRDGNNIAGCNLYVSLMPELEVYDLPVYGSNAMPQVSTDIKYGNEDHSYKFSTSSDFRLFFNSDLLSALPADATLVSFYVYHTKASSVNYQYIQNDPWGTTDKASLASNAWTKVTLTRSEVKNMCNDSSNYWVRAQDWDGSVTYYVSGLYFENRWFKDYSPSSQPFSLETTEVYPGDSKAWKIERTSAEPCWIQLETGLMDVVPASVTQIYFYVKTDKALDVQYINDNYTADGEAWSTVLATTVANNWVKVTLNRTQFERMCATPAKYRIRVNQWATGTYYLSEIHWAETESRVATYNSSTATKDSIEGVYADLRP